MQKDDLPLQIFYSALQTKDLTTRQNFLEELSRVLEDSLPYCNGHHSVVNGNNNSHHQSNGDSNIQGGIASPERHLPVLLRLSLECPFEDVRLTCSNILVKLEEQGISIPKQKYAGPSKFISSRECVPINTDDEELYLLFVDAYLMTGRLSHANQLMGYHVQYLYWFLKLESHILRADGPLTHDWRYYIGIMGAARHHSSILVQHCEQMFLIHSGNPDWLKGKEYLPKKIQNIHKLNNLLAHRPWLITQDVIKDLLTGDASESWRVSELLQAIVILTHFQSLAGFIYGCGVTPEIDMEGGHYSSVASDTSNLEPSTPTKDKANSMESSRSSCSVDDGGLNLYEKIRRVNKEAEDGEGSQDGEEEEESLQQFKEVESKELMDTTTEEFESSLGTLNKLYDKYLDDPDFHYTEFAKRDKGKVNVLRAQDYSWQEHCFSFINRLYPTVGTILEEKFNCLVNLTYNTVGDNTNIDTSKFRLATWNYIHLIYGICHDDYMYYEVNTLLERSYKMYIKKVSCFPERITFEDYWDFYTDLQPSEKVHINLLVLESRLQACLLYALRAITGYMDE